MTPPFMAVPGANCHGLIIGINEYQDPRIPKLRFTRADAKSFYEHLVDPARSGFPPSNVRLLENEEATRKNIERAISGWLFRNATQESTVVVFFAGHGGLESDKTGSEKDGIAKYLMPWDADVEDLFASALSSVRFQELLSTIRAQRLVVFMDACYTGGITKGGRDVGIVESPFRRIAEGRGRIVIASAHPSQRSWEDEALGHGIFTYHLMEALQGKADIDDDGCVSVMEIFRYLQDTVPATARRLANSLQEPLLFGEQISRDLILTVNSQHVMDLARQRIESERMRSERIREMRRKLFNLHDQGEMPLDVFHGALAVIEKAPEFLTIEERTDVGLLDALVEGKISVGIYLNFVVPHRAAAGRMPTANPPVQDRLRMPSAVPEPTAHERRYCEHCGTKVIRDNKYCIGCGKEYGS
jgi:uncharacterized caspase-like protein